MTKSATKFITLMQTGNYYMGIYANEKGGFIQTKPGVKLHSLVMGAAVVKELLASKLVEPTVKTFVLSANSNEYTLTEAGRAA